MRRVWRAIGTDVGRGEPKQGVIVGPGFVEQFGRYYDLHSIVRDSSLASLTHTIQVNACSSNFHCLAKVLDWYHASWASIEIYIDQ